MESLISPPPTHDHGAPTPRSEHPPVDAAAVHQVLEEAIASQPFCHTLQCQNLLRYIVKHSLTQEDHLLRERVIGAEVFGRRPDYDTGEDPVVRIRAAEVRKRLAQFYQSNADVPNPPDVHIDIPSGTYRASFRWREGARPTPLAAADLLPAPRPGTLPAPTPLLPQPELRPLRPTLSRWLAWALLASAVFLCGFLGYKAIGSSQQRSFRSFWQPWISSSKPVILSVGSNAVYRVSAQVTERYAREHNLEPYGQEFYIPTGPHSEITGADIVPAYSSFVALGDVAAVSNVVAALTRQEHTFQLRFPDDVSFAELRNTPTVLIGGFNNPMTVELTKNLPFVLRERNQIQDTLSPGRSWTLHASNDSHDTEDYAIITRLAQPNGDAPILSVAGMGQYGTLAAAQFICDPASIARLAHKLSPGWANRNLQLVLHVHVVDFKPASTSIVAVHTW